MCLGTSKYIFENMFEGVNGILPNDCDVKEAKENKKLSKTHITVLLQFC